MRKVRKKIGIITSEIASTYERKMILGIQKEAYERDYDVLLFSTFANGQMWREYLTGATNIFSLIDYDSLDGIIIIPIELMKQKELHGMMDTIVKKYSNKMVSADYQMNGVTSIVENMKLSLRIALEHLYEVHGVRDIACMTGPEDDSHSQERLQCYLDFMKEKNLPIREDRIFYGDFWYDKGEEVLDAMLRSPSGLPEAVCCTSDTMGLSLYEACCKYRISVPEELMITGFDAEGSGVVKPYFLTSVARDAENMGVNAVRQLINQLEGTSIPMAHMESKLISGKTCGCKDFGKKEQEILNLVELRQNIYDSFHSAYNFMMEDGIDAKGIEECLWKIDFYGKYIKEKTGYNICLTDDWTGNEKDEANYRKSGYSTKINWIYSWYRESRCVDGNRYFDKKEMLPVIWKERKYPSTFCFTPLHFMGRCFGYAVVQFDKKPKLFPEYYWGWVRHVCNLLETMRRYINMEKINAQLVEAYRMVEKNAIMDSLTGLYNRNGFNVLAQEQMQRAEKEGKHLVVLMADLNDLKYINDTYGHAEGDYAIQQAGYALKKFFMEHEVEAGKCYRIGGDEYTVVYTEDLSDEEISARAQRIADYLSEINETGGKPYKIAVSIGISREDPTGKNLDQVILAADRQMYEEKKRMKQERNNQNS